MIVSLRYSDRGRSDASVTGQGSGSESDCQWHCQIRISLTVAEASEFEPP